MRKVNKKLFFAMLLNITLASVAILAVMIFGIGQIVDRLATDDVEASMRTIKAMMGQHKSTSLSASMVLAQNRFVIQAMEEGCPRRLRTTVETVLRDTIPESDPCFVTITDSRGNVIARTHCDEIADNIALRHGVSHSLVNRLLSDFELDGETDISIVSTVPVTDADGFVIGTIAVGYDLGREYFVEHLRDITKSEITVFARDLSVMSTVILGDGSGERAVGTRLRPDIAEAVLERQEIFHEQTQIPPRPGETFLVYYVPIIDETGATLGAIFAGQNLTDVLAMENRAIWFSVSIAGAAIIIAVILSIFIIRAMIALRLEKSMEESRAKSRFLSTMSHEIRTPLNGIIGMAGIAKEAAESEEKDQYIGKIETASNHLLNVINEILDISKIEAGKLELDIHSFEFKKMVDNIVTSILGMQIEEKGLNFTVELDEEIPRFIVTDEIRLTQVITNLLSNAIKFSYQDSNLSLKATHLTSRGKSVLCVEVIDEGIGMTKEQQSRLFDEFAQAEAYTARKYGGTGLGLPICKQIVEMMDGKIWAKSEYGKGSVFTFAIPVEAGDSPKGYEEAADSAAHTDIDTDRFKDYRVLLAEDVEMNREIALIQLEQTGVEVDCAKDGEEAVQMFTDSPERYDLILMDLRMPTMDGIAATKLIRSQNTPKAESIPIIALTASVFKEEIDVCLAAGMNGHLAKPMDIGKMLELFEKYFR